MPFSAMKSRAWPVTSRLRLAVTVPDSHEMVPTVVVPTTAVLEAYGSKKDSVSVPAGAVTVTVSM